MRPMLPGYLAVFLFFLSAPIPVAAAEVSEQTLPPLLRPWTDWVLHGDRTHRCPLLYNGAHRRCAWPSALSLHLGADGGVFSQQWMVDAESWLILPGDREYWPQDVRLEDEPVVVLERDGRPVVKAQTGRHTLSGRFFWRTVPESLQVSPETALLSLTVAGDPIVRPLRETDGTLWLRKKAAPDVDKQDYVEFQVHRKIADGIPLTLDTLLKLKVSGQARELLLSRALPAGFIPLALESALPARLEPDGRLRLQIRPGAWEIRLQARHDGPVENLSPPAPDGPWATQEVWVFEANNALRVVSLEGPPTLDPAQTELPADWRRFPAFLMTPDETLRLETRQRGDADPAPDRLTLQKTLWLDFDGGGYTVQDRLSGAVSASARLETQPAVQLGRVAVNGREQFITRLDEGAAEGVEVRQGRIELVADSRLEPASIGDLPAVGWRLSPIDSRAALNLPPGWRLLAVQGADGASDTWLLNWTLLDLFIVMITAVAFARLWGWPYGALALLGLALFYQEPNAPRLVWLNLLAAIALLRVLPPGRLEAATRWYRNLAALALVVLVLAFSVQQIRSGLYPQLAPVSFAPFYSFEAEPPVASMVESPVAMEAEVFAAAPLPAGRAPKSSPARADWYYSPDVKVQTGPGLPAWNWRQAVLRWNGPVAEDQRLRLTLLPPWATRLVLFFGVALALAMLLRVFAPQGWKLSRRLPAAFLVLWAMPFTAGAQLPSPDLAMPSTAGVQLPSPKLLTAGAPLPSPDLAMPFTAGAQLPSPELLKELRNRLTEAPDCLPGCASLSHLQVRTVPDLLQLRLDLHAQIEVAAPLPVPAALQPRRVALDGEGPAPLFRDKNGLLWARLPAGLHSLEIDAPLSADLDSFQLPLPMRPGRVALETEGWLVEGVFDGRADGSIRLQRPAAGSDRLQPGVLPVFARVERELVLDIDWQVHTRVQRLGEDVVGAGLTIPLLAGERVTTPGVRVENGRVLLNLQPGQLEAAWSSTLDRREKIVLEAAETDDFVEIWRLQASPLWHVESEGIPVIHRHDSGGQWAPEWRPWPSESVIIEVSRPQGVEGKTLTIDSAVLQVAPGERAVEASLELRIRASRGQDHALQLPEGAELTTVTLDGRSQPIRLSGRSAVLPLSPGSHTATLNWRGPEGIAARYITPTVDLGTDSVNNRIILNLPRDRWTLFAGGPLMGPAVLFWGVLAVILLAALALGRFADTPLKAWHWFLLGAGLSQAGVFTLLLVPGWLLFLSRRRKLDETTSNLAFNAFQVLLFVSTLAALAALLTAIEKGLLGLPDMQIAGNGSSAWRLLWYQDRSAGMLPQGWALSVPMWAYRGLMLAWALWLAFALLRWLGWAWSCFSSGGIWRQLKLRKAKN